MLTCRFEDGNTIGVVESAAIELSRDENGRSLPYRRTNLHEKSLSSTEHMYIVRDRDRPMRHHMAAAVDETI